MIVNYEGLFLSCFDLKHKKPFIFYPFFRQFIFLAIKKCSFIGKEKARF